MESRTDPMAPNTIGDDSADEEIAGEQEPLKMYEDGPAPPPGALDTAFPATSPTESAESDPGCSAVSARKTYRAIPDSLPAAVTPASPAARRTTTGPAPKKAGRRMMPKVLAGRKEK